MCQPGGFEKFFDEMWNVPMDKKVPDVMKELMAKYGMEMLGPPIFASFVDEGALVWVARSKETAGPSLRTG
jgi:hypothetical protein